MYAASLTKNWNQWWKMLIGTYLVWTHYKGSVCSFVIFVYNSIITQINIHNIVIAVEAPPTGLEGSSSCSISDGPVPPENSAASQASPSAAVSVKPEAPKPKASILEALIGGGSHVEVSNCTKGTPGCSSVDLITLTKLCCCYRSCSCTVVWCIPNITCGLDVEPHTPCLW